MEELQLELALSSCLTQQNQDFASKKKRTFDDTFSDVTSCKRTLPLLVWDDKQHSSPDFQEEKRTQKSVFNNRSNGDVEEDTVVGWPPVKPCMRKFCGQSRRECTAANYITVENAGGGGGGAGSNSMYVKVEMEGIGIARKVDLSIYHSYRSLTSTLIAMFGKCQENGKMYKLTYQDKEGDWLLGGDVPWGNFVESVRRLKLVKTEEV